MFVLIIISLATEQINIFFLTFLCSGANNSLDYQPLFVKLAHASLLHGTIGDCTRELGANRTPQPSPSPQKQNKKQAKTNKKKRTP